MRERLPIVIEDLELPENSDSENSSKKNKSYGYVSFMYLISLMITISSILVIMFFGR